MLMLARGGFDLSGCVGRTGSRRWTPAMVGVEGGRGGTMAGRDEIVEELHVGTHWCQLNWGGFTAANANFPSIAGYQILPPSPASHANH